jgi:hypothetical protein
MDKSKVQQVLDSEPDNLDIDAFLERLYVLEKIDRSEAQLAAGQGIAHEEVKQRLSKWLK